MRIVVSGTHASGKSTLIADFALRHPEYTVMCDPFDLLDETWDAAGAASFAAQLRLSAERLGSSTAPERLIAERGPIDFLAYLLALEELGEATVSRDVLVRATDVTRDALGSVDLLVVLPLTGGISVGDEEHPELRDAMNDALLELVGDEDVVASGTRVVEIAGDRDERLGALEALIVGR